MLRRNVARFAGFALVAVMALSAAACGTTINRIMADPSHYRDRQAKISGRVVDSYSLGPRGAFLIDDQTGRLWVLSDRGVPRRGAWVKVTGTIREGYNMGSMGDRLRLPMGLETGIVLIEDYHKARF